MNASGGKALSSLPDEKLTGTAQIAVFSETSVSNARFLGGRGVGTVGTISCRDAIRR